MGVELVHVAMPSQAAARAKWPSELIQDKMTDSEYISDVSALVKRCMTGRGVQAMVIGPGMGDNQASLEAVKMLIQATPNIPKVIDADAIRALEGWPEGLVGVATPHQKELENWVGNIDAVPDLIAGSGESRVVIRTGAEDIIIGAGGRGGIGKGGLNFDAKIRRQSIDPEDLFYAHIGGMDGGAKTLLACFLFTFDAAAE